jgi:hypothetical protein
MTLTSISNGINTSDQQRLFQQMRAAQMSDASATTVNAAAISYARPLTSPSPRPGSPLATLPPTDTIDGNNTLSDNADNKLTQRLTGVRSFLLTLQSVMPTTDIPSSQSITRMGAAIGRTLLTI